MAMKLDKEFFLKHNFWIGLGVFALLWVVVLVLLPFTIGSEARAKHTDYTKAVGDVDRIKVPPKDFANPNWDRPLQEKEAILKKRKDKVWDDSWKTQSTLMDWPGDSIAPLTSELRNAYFLDPIPKADERQRYEDTLYAGQWTEFKGAITPAYYNGGDYRTILQPVTTWATSPPVSDECWFAQEDLWVKRELIHSIAEAIKNVARFERVEAPKDVPAGAKAVQSFKNVNWAVTLVLETATGKDKKQHLIISPKSTITNINPNYRKMPLTGVFLEVDQRDKSGALRDRAYLTLEGDPVPWGDTVSFKSALKNEARVDTFVPDQPMDVQQRFTWFTSPVKRLDRLEVGNRSALSHRFAKWGLVTKSSAAAGDNAAPADTPAPPTGGALGMPSMSGAGSGGMPGMMTSLPGPGGMGSGPPGLGGRAGAGQGGTVERDRYLEVSDQVRRMPVAMVLVVDQSRIQDVLTALIDNRLHVWITQWEWQHAHGVAPPSKIELAPEQGPEGEETAGEGGFPRGGMAGRGGFPTGSMPMGPMTGPDGPSAAMYGGSSRYGAGRPGGSGAGAPPIIGSGMPRTGSGMPGMGAGMPGMGSGMPGMGSGMPRFGGFGPLPPSDQMAVSQDDANLVELTVYGIASLYERYPPKPPAGEGGAASGQNTGAGAKSAKP